MGPSALPCSGNASQHVPLVSSNSVHIHFASFLSTIINRCKLVLDSQTLTFSIGWESINLKYMAIFSRRLPELIFDAVLSSSQAYCQTSKTELAPFSWENVVLLTLEPFSCLSFEIGSIVDNHLVARTEVSDWGRSRLQPHFHLLFGVSSSSSF